MILQTPLLGLYQLLSKPWTLHRRRFLQLVGGLAFCGSGLSGRVDATAHAKHNGNLSRKANRETVRFFVIGDFGQEGRNAHGVAEMIKAQAPDFITTVGDNNYNKGGSNTIDANIGLYYQSFIHPYRGRYGRGADRPRFFPALGNHDWESISWNAEEQTWIGPYFDYFSFDGNANRYYATQWGSIDLFSLDSDSREPDGIDGLSDQAMWLRDELASSRASWKIVHLHHSPYSSGSSHGSHTQLQWPFAEWGADLVISGHDHHYERISQEGIVYIVNGTGGKSLSELSEKIVKGSVYRYNQSYGAVRIDATENRLEIRYISALGKVLDGDVLQKESVDLPTVPQEELSLVRQIADPADHIVIINRNVVEKAEELVLGNGYEILLHFPNIPLPVTAQITSVVLEFTAVAVEDLPTTISIRGVLSSDWSDVSATVSGHEPVSTSAQVLWCNVPGADKIGQQIQTPDLSPLVQEIVAQTDWRSGHGITFRLYGNGQRSICTVERQPRAAPQLRIGYRASESRIAVQEQQPSRSSSDQSIYLPFAPSSQCSEETTSTRR